MSDSLPGDRCFSTVLDNGLTVRICPMPTKRGVYALLGAKIGSTTRDFKLGGRDVRVPAGVAHFLEHKLFESEQGDAFDLFAKTGASANAYTSFEQTCYLFSTSINSAQSLKTLINFVGEPHFTDETVAKEQGIIGQEIKMYDDNADWVLTMMTLGCLYNTHPIRDDIAGTVNSIAEITPQLLYDCYNAFYRPQNMALCIAGNVDPDEVLEIARSEYSKTPACPQTVERMEVCEANGIKCGSARREMRVSMPQFCLGYKHDPSTITNRLERAIAIKLLISVIASETSPLYRSLYDDGLINETFDGSSITGDDFCCSVFCGESSDPEKVAAAIRAEIENTANRGINTVRFEECRRSLLGRELCLYDSIENVASRMMDSHFKDYGIYDIIDEIKNITAEKSEKVLREAFDNSRSAIAVINPQREQEQL